MQRQTRNNNTDQTDRAPLWSKMKDRQRQGEREREFIMAEARKNQIKTHKVNSTQIEHAPPVPSETWDETPTAHSFRLSTQSNYLSLRRLNGLEIRMKKNIEQSNEFEFNFLIHRKRRLHSAPAHSDHHSTDTDTYTDSRSTNSHSAPPSPTSPSVSSRPPRPPLVVDARDMCVQGNEDAPYTATDSANPQTAPFSIRRRAVPAERRGFDHTRLDDWDGSDARDSARIAGPAHAAAKRGTERGNEGEAAGAHSEGPARVCSAAVVAAYTLCAEPSPAAAAPAAFAASGAAPFWCPPTASASPRVC